MWTIEFEYEWCMAWSHRFGKARDLLFASGGAWRASGRTALCRDARALSWRSAVFDGDLGRESRDTTGFFGIASMLMVIPFFKKSTRWAFQHFLESDFPNLCDSWNLGEKNENPSVASLPILYGGSIHGGFHGFLPDSVVKSSIIGQAWPEWIYKNLISNFNTFRILRIYDIVYHASISSIPSTYLRTLLGPLLVVSWRFPKRWCGGKRNGICRSCHPWRGTRPLASGKITSGKHGIFRGFHVFFWMVISWDLPSGKQTWQWEIPYEWRCW